MTWSLPSVPPCCQKLWFRYLACFFLGSFGALGFPSYDLFPLLLLSLSIFWLVLTSFALEAPKRSFLAGYAFGFGYFLVGLWWIGNALLIDGNVFKWAWPLAVCGLPVILAPFPMLAAGISRLFAKGRSLPSFLFFIAAMAASEWIRGHAFTGFPWNLYGMTWTFSLPMLQILSIGGIYLLSILTLFWFTAPAFALFGEDSPKIRWGVLGVALASWAAVYGFGVWRIDSHPTAYNTSFILQVVQPNIPQGEKWDGEKRWDNYLKTIRLSQPVANSSFLSQEKASRLIILPETAFGYRELEDSEAGQALRDTLAMFPQPTYLLTGALLRSADDKTGQLAYHNSLLVVNQETRILESFDKFHLVPFGEYIPFQSYIPIAPIVQFSGFVEGPGPRTLAVENIPPFSPLVCYEVIFSGSVTDRDKRPQWIVNVTNDAWYGLSPGPFQHFGQTIYRAIEEGLPLVRSTNTGISAILDPYGRSVAKSGLYEDSVLESYLPSPILAPPPYTFFQDGIFLLLLIACITPIFLAITRKKIWV